MFRLRDAVPLFLGALVLAGGAGAERSWPADWPVYVPPEIQKLQATETARFPAPEAGQGVAVDADYVYAVGNFVIAKYDRDTGERVAQWRGERGGYIGHLNSCYTEESELWCANSNHPKLPFANSVEVFNKSDLSPRKSIPLGVMDEGSLVWFDHYGDDWIVGMAHYNDETGLPFKDNTFASVYIHDFRWRQVGGWALPLTLVERMAPQAASGGAIGPDGLLYMMGHDRPEMYVMARPPMGPYLVHIATISIDAEGQAFDFDESRPGEVCAISRPNREIRCFKLPAVSLPQGLLSFEGEKDSERQ
nr:hypothetical protein [uncultured Hyphomonas sp.]